MQTEYPSYNNNFSSPSTVEKISFGNLDKFGLNTGKYRNIPVTKTSDNLKTSGDLYESMPGVKEMKNILGSLKAVPYSTTNSIFKYKSLTETPNQLSKLDPGYSLQRKCYPEFFVRMGQGSVSEPALAVAKDRGDSIAFPAAPKQPGLKGCLYIKRAGKVYMSKIEAESFQAEADGAFQNRRKDMYGRCPRVEKSISKIKAPGHVSVFDTNSSNLNSKSDDDFEIAIFLSGLNETSGRNAEKISCGVRKVKKKRNARKHNAKKFHMVKQSSRNMQKLLRSNSRNIDRSNLTYTVINSDTDFEFSSKESDFDTLSNGGVKMLKRNSKRISGSPSIASTCNSTWKPPSQKTGMSMSSISPYGGDMYRTSNLRVRDEELWEKFEILFRSYASTSRHSGEVIPRKISTEWMVNVGIVDDYLTEKEANEAFKHAAGTRITMNVNEYKEFLIALSLRMKLPFYEIYRRMCGM